jgi:hypothetical protein
MSEEWQIWIAETCLQLIAGLWDTFKTAKVFRNRQDTVMECAYPYIVGTFLNFTILGDFTFFEVQISSQFL